MTNYLRKNTDGINTGFTTEVRLFAGKEPVDYNPFIAGTNEQIAIEALHVAVTSG